MVFLFFIVGFLTVVNQQFQGPLQKALLSGAESIKNTLATMITFSWFLAYPLTGGIGTKLVNRLGYKGALVRGLLVIVAGTAIFECSVLFQQYSGAEMAFGNVSIPYAYFIFLIGSFVVGSGATIMQVAINPYLVACEVKGTSDIQRQNIGGSANSIGTTIAPFVIGGLIFGGNENIALDTLIVPFAVLMAVVLLVSFIVKKLNLPNVEGTTSEAKLESSVWNFRHLTLGVIAIFLYVGVEVCVGANIVLNAKSLGGSWAENAALLGSLYWGGMLVGRLIGSALSSVSAKAQLLATSVAAAVIVTIAMLTENLWIMAAVGLFHSIMWPAIFALALKGLGKYTSAASGALMIGVIGGGIMPLLQGMWADASNGLWTMTWIIVIIGEAYLIYYALIGCKNTNKTIKVD